MESNFPQGQTRGFVRRVGESLTLRLLLLTSLVVALYAVLSLFATRFEPAVGIRWLTLSAGICLSTGGTMLVIDWLGCSVPPQQSAAISLMHVALGFVVRMGLPLMACAFVAIRFDTASAQSLSRYLLVMYPLVLLLETVFTVWRRGCSQTPQSDHGALLQAGVEG